MTDKLKHTRTQYEISFGNSTFPNEQIKTAQNVIIIIERVSYAR